jgi:NADH-quinone oxidoreductase subunit J
MPKPPLKRTLFSLLAVLFGFAFSYRIIYEYGFAPAVASKPFSVPVNAIGEQMLSTSEYGFVLPFEVVSMLLLAAMVGCIVIALKAAPGKKTVHIDKLPKELSDTVKVANEPKDLSGSYSVANEQDRYTEAT